VNHAKSYYIVAMTSATLLSPEPSVSPVTRAVAGKHAHRAGVQRPGRVEPRLSSTMALIRAASRLGLLLLAVVILWIPTVAGAEDTVAFTIKDARIAKSSGLAVDPATNLYWTVNDSGNRGVAYGIGLDGTVQGTLNFRAQPRDIEAVAIHEDRLYIADIGDNNSQRGFVRVYFFENPRANGLTVTYNAYDFRYPDGPHNAETLLVNDSGRLFIVTKGWKAAIYEAPAKPDRQGVNELAKVGSAPSNVTDGTFLPGGERIALLTYSTLEVIEATNYEVLASVPIPDQPQAGSLALSLNRRSLLVGSKGKQSKVYSMAVPSEASLSPTTQAPNPNSVQPGNPNQAPAEAAPPQNPNPAPQNPNPVPTYAEPPKNPDPQNPEPVPTESRPPENPGPNRAEPTQERESSAIPTAESHPS
jgi:hypothetical protein